ESLLKMPMALVARSRFSSAARSRAGGAGGLAATGGALSFRGAGGGAASPAAGSGAGAGERTAGAEGAGGADATGGGGAGAAGGDGSEADGGGGTGAAAWVGAGAAGVEGAGVAAWGGSEAEGGGGEDETPRSRDAPHPASAMPQAVTAIARAANGTRRGTTLSPCAAGRLSPSAGPSRGSRGRGTTSGRAPRRRRAQPAPAGR